MPNSKKILGESYGSAALAQQTTDIIVPALPRIYAGSRVRQALRRKSPWKYEEHILCDLGEPRKAIEFLKQSLAIGKAIENPRIIGFCEQELKGLKGYDE